MGGTVISGDVVVFVGIGESGVDVKVVTISSPVESRRSMARVIWASAFLYCYEVMHNLAHRSNPSMMVVWTIFLKGRVA